MVVDKEIAEEFIAVAHRIVWCTVATTDTKGRPRARVLHPLWEYDETAGLAGWIVTRPTPVKVAHLARTPFATCSYWDPAQDVAIADCDAMWVADGPSRARIWAAYRDAPAPLGYDFWSVFPAGPDSDEVGLLRLAPYRLRITGIETLTGQRPPTSWRRSAKAGPKAAARAAGRGVG
ncbi:pyridoxamine 5'-phosphate oxidase family protein [Kribbella deserti]|uniref:Pyridoxamine 5'-phosphate oxidase family protein n=1 Tax=Kribbella deserti TaxID=1926257 RepID=A0ABV6QI46_9ACTN